MWKQPHKIHKGMRVAVFPKKSLLTERGSELDLASGPQFANSWAKGKVTVSGKTKYVPGRGNSMCKAGKGTREWLLVGIRHLTTWRTTRPTPCMQSPHPGSHHTLHCGLCPALMPPMAPFSHASGLSHDNLPAALKGLSWLGGKAPFWAQCRAPSRTESGQTDHSSQRVHPSRTQTQASLYCTKMKVEKELFFILCFLCHFIWAFI